MRAIYQSESKKEGERERARDVLFRMMRFLNHDWKFTDINNLDKSRIRPVLSFILPLYSSACFTLNRLSLDNCFDTHRERNREKKDRICGCGTKRTAALQCNWHTDIRYAEFRCSITRSTLLVLHCFSLASKFSPKIFEFARINTFLMRSFAHPQKL